MAAAEKPATKTTDPSQDYVDIKTILGTYKQKKYEKIHTFGVITFVHSRNLTIVDPTCRGNERLKFVVFGASTENDCEPGDIIRFHRFNTQEWNQEAQGVSHQTMTSWIRFKRNDTDFKFVGNRTSNTITDYDKARVTELREWLNTNPNLKALIDCGVSTGSSDDNSENVTSTSGYIPVTTVTDLKTINKLPIPNLFNLSNVPKEGFFDIVCQVCAKCQLIGQNKKFLFCWDGTKTNLDLFQENNFEVISTSQADLTRDAFFCKSIIEYMFQVFVFDDFETHLDSLEAGDFILIKNAQAIGHSLYANKPIVLKVPGIRNKSNPFKRGFTKLAPSNDIADVNDKNQVETFFHFIKQKEKEFKLEFHSAETFKSGFIHANTEALSQDTTFLDLMGSSSNNELYKKLLPSNANGLPPNSNNKKKNFVDALLDDQTEMYDEQMTSEDSNDSFKTTTSHMAQQATIEIRSNNQPRPMTPLQSHHQPNVKNKNPADDLMEVDCSPTKKKRVNENQNETAAQFVSNNNNDTIKQGLNLKDSRKISLDIYDVKLLSKSNYLVPFIRSNQTLNSENYLMFFESLGGLEKESLKRSYTKSKVIAKFQRHIGLTSQIYQVYVSCKNCSYINYIPYNIGNMYHSTIMDHILKEYEKRFDNDVSSFLNASSQEINAETNGHASNFSLEWFINAGSDGWIGADEIATTQPRDLDENNKPVVHAECPRCKYINESNDTNKEIENTQEAGPPPLDFMYRFWFELRDPNGKLNPCLIEGSLANQIVGNIDAFKFYSKLKHDSVMAAIKSLVDKSLKYLFTIETFNLKNDLNQNNMMCKKIDVLYKIIDFQEIK